MPATLLARVHSVRPIAEGVVSIALRPASPDVGFPAFTAGSHIDLHLPNGMVRSYSIHSSSGESGQYSIGVLRDRSSRGGSSWIHSHLKTGDTIRISKPRNNFALDESAQRSVFIAGGIGITPLLSMIHRLRQLGRNAHILYCARARTQSPLLDALLEMAGDQLTVQCHFSDEARSNADIKAFLSGFAAADHFYCCGPSPMLDAFEAACEALGLPHIHVERFRAAEHGEQPAAGGQCVVELARSGRSLTIRRDKPLLKFLLEAEVEIEYSCEEGVCGACETRILAGEADHRDSVLSKSQKASNSAMMPCVSRCRSDRLVLDL
ncbi:PDR/VanB family oxidoreductase [Cupriavidus yeoncheonensis]|uniref:PDR/VanB family oxidoreductase n=1 Tax=Cupriavidus yeoncheonensis TaxID=1462994 RepID=UPI003B849DA7